MTPFDAVALATAIALGGMAGSAIAQSRTGPSQDVPARLDAPEHRIDQVGPQPVGRPPPAPAAEKEASPPVESLDDFALGARAVPDASLPPRTIQRIQLELHRRGYHPGPRDGVLGDATRDAIRRYQADRGWPVSGTVTVRLLVALQGGDRFDGGVTSIDASPLVLQIQDELKRRGYDLSVDGRLDARTVKAIESYQSYFGMEPTGEPSEALLDHVRSGVVPLIER
jgi:peptidoglycan hydrolase-like protein with peptidoglycan-binding domain